ncbi:MAG: type II toxin-antitoxin system RelE/ParE family toxin [Chitinophagales bacterium]|nr:type II toxin-antitoxin system RelE/ParE family toxin [Chitinophagales bacterium]
MKLRNNPFVKQDMYDAVAYYKDINATLAKQFLDKVKNAKTFIAQRPYACPVKYKDVRTILLKQFPYHIHYRIDENKQIVYVLAVICAYTKPSDFTSR